MSMNRPEAVPLQEPSGLVSIEVIEQPANRMQRIMTLMVRQPELVVGRL